MIKRLVPQPVLALSLVALWVLLANSFSVGTLIMGLIVGVGVARFTSSYWPDAPTITRPLLVIDYFCIFFYDIVVSNIEVARLVLFRQGDSLGSQFVTVPLDLKCPEAIVALAGTITMTPGTVTADVSEDRKSLLVHCLDTSDPEGVIASIKERYERRLKRIFE